MPHWVNMISQTICSNMILVKKTKPGILFDNEAKLKINDGKRRY